MTDKTELEKAAKAWANSRCPEQGSEFIEWCMCKEDFETGARWLRLQLEKAEYPLFGIPAGDLITSQEFEERIAFKQGLARILEKAKELCGK